MYAGYLLITLHTSIRNSPLFVELDRNSELLELELPFRAF